MTREEMTKEEATEILKEKRFEINTRINGETQYSKALEIAIKALEQEPCEDAISRQEAVEAFQMFREYESNRSNKGWVNRIETVLNQLPPVNPQPKTGHWITTSDYYTGAYGNIDYVECSCCHEYSLEDGDFCPNCGARMVEPQESEK